MRPRVLVVTQRADRTGAPTQLLTLLAGIREYLDAEMTVLIGSQGELVPEFAAIADRVRQEPAVSRALRRIERHAPSALSSALRWARHAATRWSAGRHDTVYVSSLLSTDLAEAFRSSPTIVHVHEIGAFARASGEAGRALLRRAEVLVAASGPVRGWLLGIGLPDERIRVIRGCVPLSAHETPDPLAVSELRSRLGIPAGSLVVSSVGWFGAMKGSDRFLDVAQAVRGRVPSDQLVRFVWVGGDSATPAGDEFSTGIGTRGLDSVVVTAPALRDLRPIYCMSDVVMIASQEESVSLVALESAALGCPVTCFPGAGGPDELAEEGVVLASVDASAEAMADLILEVRRGAARELQQARAMSALDTHHETGAAQKQLAALIVEVLGARARRNHSLPRARQLASSAFHTCMRWTTTATAGPLRDADTKSCLVLAPHPDDETLGCGGTIARKAAADTAVNLVIATDGELSDRYGRTEDVVRVVRRDEARAAVCRLGLEAKSVEFLGLPDSLLEHETDVLIDRIRDVLHRTNPAQVLVCAASDGHADHVALNRATRVAVSDRNVELLEYYVWAWAAWPPLAPANRSTTVVARIAQAIAAAADRRRFVRVELKEARTSKREAIAVYTSQHGSTGPDGGLPANMLAIFDARYEVFGRSR